MGEQLKRLQKGLAYDKGRQQGPRFARQKQMIKRIDNSNKQNNKSSCDISLDLNSQQLQHIRDENEELYHVFLDLYRFFQR